VKREGKAGQGGVYLLRKKAERIESAEAEDQQEALAKAFALYEICEAERFKISVQRD
jgi:hypothetical protein